MTESNGRKTKDLIKCKSKKTGLKTVPTACTFSRDGLLVAAACQDGSIQVNFLEAGKQSAVCAFLCFLVGIFGFGNW